MKIDSLVLNELPQEQRERFEEYAIKIVCESFIFTADRDYLTARFAYFQKQSHLFLWSAAQAIEKISQSQHPASRQWLHQENPSAHRAGKDA
jgi:hypothetical protein